MLCFVFVLQLFCVFEKKAQTKSCECLPFFPLQFSGSSVSRRNQRRRFISLPCCVITLKLPRHAHGKFSGSGGAGSGTLLRDSINHELLRLCLACTPGPLIPQHLLVPPLSAPLSAPSSRLERRLTSGENTSRDGGGVAWGKGPAGGRCGVRDGEALL